MADLMEDISGLHCSKDNHFLYVSDLFVYLKKYLNALVGDTPHGLSKQMGKVLISFREPDTPLNQVLYCSSGTGNYELAETFVRKYCSSTSPSKYFDYNGEEVCAHPMTDGCFLVAYFTSDLLAVSFQKRLIEQVINARRPKQSLMDTPSFCTMYVSKRNNVAVTVYVHTREVDMDKDTDSIRSQARLGSWAEFDMKFSKETIYCSGTSHGVDATRTLISTLRKQKPIAGFGGERLPSSTFFYNQWAISDLESVFDFTSRQEYARATYSDYIKERDEEWMDPMKEYTGENVISYLFQSKDSADRHPCAIVSIIVEDEVQAGRYLQDMFHATPKEKDASSAPQTSPNYQQCPRARKYHQYTLPRNTALTRLISITKSALHTYTCFYKEALLLTPDAQSSSAYVDTIESEDALNGISAYKEGADSLSPYYNFAMMVDMEETMHQPGNYVRLVPNPLFRQSELFRHFMIGIQLTCTKEMIYPNLVLLYKGDKMEEVDN